MDDLYDKFEIDLDALVELVAYDEVVSSPLAKDSDLIKFVDNIWDQTEQGSFKIDKISILTTFMIQYCLKMVKDNINEEGVKIESFIKTTLILFDIANHLDEEKEQGFFYIQILSTVFSLITTYEELFNRLLTVYFSKDNEARRLKLTHDNKLLGKLRPGSKLLSLYKQMSPKVSNIQFNNETVVEKYREMIYGSFEISDKLSQSLEWKINSLNSIYESVIDSKVVLKGSQKPNSDPLNFSLLNYSKIINSLNATPLPTIIQTFNNYNIQKNNEYGLNQIPSLLKSLKDYNPKVQKSVLDSIDDFEPQLLLDYKSFVNQLTSFNKFWSLNIQLLIISNLFSEMTFEQMNPLLVEANRELPKKFKRPEHISRLITSQNSKRVLNDWYNDYLNFIKTEFKSNEINYVLKSSERTWTLMKLKLFNHPRVESVQKISENNKRTYEEYIESIDGSKISKKPRFSAAMGTPKLSKLWRTKTGVTNLKARMESHNSVLEIVKDDLYFVKGDYMQMKESTERDETGFQKASEKYQRLNWKGMRTARDAGQWLKLCDCDDENTGVEGLWN